jgi:AcrR family transcriptional regulator
VPRSDEANLQIRNARREHILQVAERLFQEKDLTNIQIGELAKAANMSLGLFYRYFDNKEDLFLALVEKEAATLTSMFLAVRQTEGCAIEKLHSLIKTMMASIYQNPRQFLIIIQGLNHPGESTLLVEKMKEIMKDTLLELIIAAQAEGSIVQDDPDSLGILILSSLQGLASSITFFGCDAREQRPTAEQVMRLLKP